MTDLPELDRETYVGDGIYAKFDGFQVWLRAPREGGDHLVALEPQTYQALRAWIDSFPALKQHMEGT